jgi:hypothetical protein
MIKLCSHPHTEFGPGRQDAESLRNVSNCPSLKVEFVDGIDGPGRKSSFKVLFLIPRINSLDSSSVRVRDAFSGNLVIENRCIMRQLICNMNPIVLDLQCNLVLLIVNLSLKKLSVLRESHVFIFEWQGL